MSVAPSRASSRTRQQQKQQFDEDPPEVAARNSNNVVDGGNGAVPNGGDGAEDDEDEVAAVEGGGVPAPRGDRSPNHAASATAASANTVAVINGDSEDEEEYGVTTRVSRVVNGGGGGYWRQVAASRPSSPQGPMADNASDASSMVPPPRPKSRAEFAAASRYGNLSYWRARRIIFYRNGDPFFPGIEFRFKPGRDIYSLETLLDKLSLRMDLPRGARYVFSMDGDRKFRLEELEDGASYVVSSYKTFKVNLPLNSYEHLLPLFRF